jgi:hypothetical protein
MRTFYMKRMDRQTDGRDELRLQERKQPPSIYARFGPSRHFPACPIDHSVAVQSMLLLPSEALSQICTLANGVYINHHHTNVADPIHDPCLSLSFVPSDGGNDDAAQRAARESKRNHTLQPTHTYYMLKEHAALLVQKPRTTRHLQRPSRASLTPPRQPTPSLQPRTQKQASAPFFIPALQCITADPAKRRQR